MSFDDSAVRLIERLGGRNNISSVMHCMTRLRFVLVDESLVKDEEVKCIEGVAGVVRQAGQYQIIVGKNVANFYKSLMSHERSLGEGLEKQEDKKNRKNVFSFLVDVLSSCMIPVIPVLVGAGMLKILYLLLGFYFSKDLSTLQYLLVISDAAFYFMPTLIAFSAAKKFGANPMLVVAVIGLLLHPDFVKLINNEGNTFLGIKVISTHYSSTVIPAILIAWMMSYVEKAVDKIAPSISKAFLNPALVLLISAPVAFLILGPIGSVMGTAFADLVGLVQNKFYIVTMVVLCALMPFIVMTGMHWALAPLFIAALAGEHGDTLILPAMLVSNMSQGAACIGVWLKSKDTKLKQTSFASGLTAIVSGLTEPCMYGVNLPLKKPMIAACVSAGLTGFFIGAVKLSAFAFSSPALVSLPIFISQINSNNLLFACIAVVLTIIMSITFTWLLGFNDPVSQSEFVKNNKNTSNEPVSEPATEEEPLIINSPLNGKVIKLETINDVTFSSGVIGQGVAILPAEGKVYAPFDGTIASLLPSMHAVGLVSDRGVELLIHIGLETVTLGGKYFKSYIKEGDKISQGDLMIEFDLNSVVEEGFDIITPVVITNSDDYSYFELSEKNITTISDAIISLKKEA
ncbi:beta-glucoside-specific PTS transporter subunit IIABC [Raoultella sp. T31]|uniref:beta-glucoside-specific PTS transporter subunit IIABC n=1 Tax=Raoultella sp. T31 TaxID=2054594 RepID=UPI000C2897DB|nr:PTS beta-glucoside transporter subunit EIIBCA [Raoultella sp. T31]